MPRQRWSNRQNSLYLQTEALQLDPETFKSKPKHLEYDHELVLISGAQFKIKKDYTVIMTDRFDMYFMEKINSNKYIEHWDMPSYSLFIVSSRYSLCHIVYIKLLQFK